MEICGCEGCRAKSPFRRVSHLRQKKHTCARKSEIFHSPHTANSQSDPARPLQLSGDLQIGVRLDSNLSFCLIIPVRPSFI